MSDNKVILIPIHKPEQYDSKCHPWMESKEIKYILDVLYQKQNDIDLPNHIWSIRLEYAMYMFAKSKIHNYISRDYLVTWQCPQNHPCWDLFTIYAKKDSDEDEWQNNIEEQINNILEYQTCKLCDNLVKNNLEWHIQEE